MKNSQVFRYDCKGYDIDLPINRGNNTNALIERKVQSILYAAQVLGYEVKKHDVYGKEELTFEFSVLKIESGIVVKGFELLLRYSSFFHQFESVRLKGYEQTKGIVNVSSYGKGLNYPLDELIELI